MWTEAVAVADIEPIWLEPQWLVFLAASCLGWTTLGWIPGHDDKFVHDVHAVTVVGVCLLALSGRIPEIATVLFSCGYFVADTFGAIAGGRWKMLIAHHVPSLCLFVSQPFYPAMREHQFASLLLLIEASTPLLTRWRRSRRKGHFMQFMAVFFCLRIVYLTWLGTTFHANIGGWPCVAAWALVVVNVYWFLMQSSAPHACSPHLTRFDR